MSVTRKKSEAWVTQGGVDIKCAKMAIRSLPSQVVRLDPWSYGYKDCDCFAGWGTPPGCKVEPIKSVAPNACLPADGTKMSGARQGQSIQWLIRPEPAARVIYLTFLRFETTGKDEVSLEVLFGETIRGQRMLSYVLVNSTGQSIKEIPTLNVPILVGDRLYGSEGSIVVHLQTTSEDFDVRLVQFNYTSRKECEFGTEEDADDPRKCKGELAYIGMAYIVMACIVMTLASAKVSWPI